MNLHFLACNCQPNFFVVLLPQLRGDDVQVLLDANVVDLAVVDVGDELLLVDAHGYGLAVLLCQVVDFEEALGLRRAYQAELAN